MARQIDKIFFRSNREMLANSFGRIGLERGITVCVHSSLSRLGYIEGGAEAVLDALMETVDEEGCILMPCFSMKGSMESYLDQGEVFDVRKTPSQTGLITEVFRKRSGVLRSLHPTNSVAAWGNGAKELLRDHERSPTPYGPDTPYGRLAKSENCFILMLETHLYSFLHHLQERVHFPCLYLPEEREASFVDELGQRRTMRTKVMRPKVPYFVAIPSTSGPEPDWTLIQDFALMFPKGREKTVKRLGYRLEGYPKLYRRRKELEISEVLRSTRLGRGEIGLLHVKSFLAIVEPELHDLIERFRPYYDSDRIAAFNLPFS